MPFQTPGETQHAKGTAPMAEELAVRRAERFERLANAIETHECSEVIGHDQTRPGASRDGRYVVHAQGDGGRSELTRCNDRKGRAQIVCESQLNEGWTIVALYDLDVLAGREPGPVEGDLVKLTTEGITHELPLRATKSERANAEGEFYVIGSETDTFDGEAYEKLYLSRKPEADYLGGDYDLLIDECYVTIVTPGEGDERLPVRYDVAGIVQQVIFNTIPTVAS